MEDQCADARGKQCDADVQTRQQRDQDRGAGHGESVLEAKGNVFARAVFRVFLRTREQLVQYTHVFSSCILYRGEDAAQPGGASFCTDCP